MKNREFEILAREREREGKGKSIEVVTSGGGNLKRERSETVTKKASFDDGML